MKRIKFKNGLRDELRKVVGIQGILDELGDFKNNQNIKPKYFGP